ncbi:thioredoxin-like protein AAED1, chloroplastic isoform X2 [Dendrobium catenatum]|uniref:thioredoxin-like protein AAED1, chloroplastic isoform X2 n=1 Tax=Dendrobium catenatum TaxID=906689 RepID=UPI0009F21D51|nr:thioredoxin-like protein AAED1, chloroplastic isoform X2 [Dendrobium catenatum]
MAMNLAITTPLTAPRLPLIRPSASAHPRNSCYPTMIVSTYHTKKSCRFSRFLSPIPSTVSSSGIASTASDEDITSSLEKVEVYDLMGKAIPIFDLWRDRKAVVAFARHFGCVLCRKRADILASKKAIAFFEQTQFKGEVYADPTHSSFDALNFAYGVSTTFTPKAGMKIIESYLEGYRQDWGLSFKENTRSKGGWQQGGILVAGPGTSNISYFHKDKEAGDDPNVEDVLQACCS